MKNRILFSVLTLAALLTSCEKESAPVPSCYRFTTTTKTTCTPYLEGMNGTVVSNTEQCNLLPDDAEVICESIKSSSTTTSGSYTIKTTVTCTYKKI
jgi:uncharacterized lipoprotein YbaY